MNYRPKTPPCTSSMAAPPGRHRWAFVKNFTQTSATLGAGGSSVRMTTKGLYKCACGQTKVGAYNVNAPGMDLLDAVRL